METYVALLRGINVGSKNRIKMDELIYLFKQLNFTSIQTYIQSGNVLFQTDKNIPSSEVQTKIETILKEKLKNDIPVILRTKIQWREIYLLNPFYKRNDYNNNTYVSFLEKDSSISEQKLIDSFPNEEFIIQNNEIYLWCEKGYSETKLSNNAIEKKLKIKSTTRNWKTISEINALFEKYL
jgi:uncharacterized protein (DUF1697 family)